MLRGATPPGGTAPVRQGYFQLKALGEAKVKGVSEPVRIYEVAGVGTLRTRMGVALQRGRLWQNLGKKEEARRMLAKIYGWFTEGFDTRDLKEANALLEELSD